MTPPVILASGSQIRRTLLETAGLPVSCIAPRVDEETLRESFAAEGVPPRDQADALAEMKAARVGAAHPGALVIGADQVLDIDGEVLGKPRTEEELRDQLARLSGRIHKLHSAAVIFQGSRPVWRHVGTARLTMHPLSPGFVGGYVARNWGEIRHSVGGYQVEAEGVRLFSRIEGSYHVVLGLPLVELLSYLVTRGVLET